MLTIFEEKIEKCHLTKKIHCILQSAEDMDFKSLQFDIIAATVALHHVEDKQPVIRNIYDYLKMVGDSLSVKSIWIRREGGKTPCDWIEFCSILTTNLFLP